MPFNISNFKSAFDRHGGPAKASLFELRISHIPKKNTSRIGARDFSFFCKSATVPGLSISTAEDIKVAQLKKAFPTTLNKEPLNTIFMVDSNHEILTFFVQWMQTVVNFGTSGGMYSDIDDQLPFEVGYKSDYSMDITVRHYTTDSLEFKFQETKFINAYPVSMGDLELSWDDNDSFLTLPISFEYDRFQLSNEIGGSNTSRLGRGSGLLETIGAIAGFADVVRQTVNQGSGITSIQDAVNRLTRVRNSFDNISDVFGGG